MRIKITGKIIEKTNMNKMNYTHGLYSMIMNHVNQETVRKFHNQQKEIRLFSFTNTYISNLNKDGLGNVHFYICGEDKFVKDFINSMELNGIIRIEDMVVSITKITELDALEEKQIYIFNTKVIINIPNMDKNKGVRLVEDINNFEQRLKINSIKKAKLIGIEGSVDFKILKSKQNVERYKNGHIFSLKCEIEATGDYDVINTIYQCGLGENTGSGHGFLWEGKK